MRNWNILDECNGRPLLETLFHMRNIGGTLSEYLELPMSGLENPALLPDIGAAAVRIRTALNKQEKIVVYGDYDVDGITATVLLIRWLRRNGGDCGWYIPDRRAEGYGLHTDAVKAIIEQGAKLLITVDTGTTGYEAADYANEHGLDIIITDHHAVRDTIPAAAAVVNPKRQDCVSDSGLAGVGVVFQLIRYLEGIEHDENTMRDFGAMAALGTAADIMPMTRHNRTLIRHGLRILEQSPGCGLQALLLQAGVSGKRLSSTQLSYGLAPRINAAGRLGETHVAVQLLLSDENNEAERLSETLCRLNRERQSIESGLLLQAMEQAEERAEQPVMVLAGENWHPGVVGIVASRMADKLNKPVFLISVENGTGKGSSRCHKGFNLVNALAANENLLINYGGHDSAAGFVVEESNIAALTDGLQRYAAEAGVSETDTLTVDLRLTPQEVTLENAVLLQNTEPYGHGNTQPLFCMNGMTVTAARETADGKHTRFQFRRDGSTYNAIWFGKRLSESDVQQNQTADVAFAMDVNTFRDTESLQLIVSDLKADFEFAAYDKLKQGLPLDADSRAVLAVSRDDVARVWRAAEQASAEGITADALQKQTGLPSQVRVFIALDILCQIGLLHLHIREDDIHIEIKHRGKTDLCRSAFWNALNGEG
jgi:single-stranded-DNA-specific exonuclease